MAAQRDAREHLFDTTWVHVFEEDGAQGAVYRPEEHDIPLSRRLRERLKLARNGSAKLFVPAPNDQLTEQRVRWRDAGDSSQAAPASGTDVRIVESSPARLVVQISGKEA